MYSSHRYHTFFIFFRDSIISDGKDRNLKTWKRSPNRGLKNNGWVIIIFFLNSGYHRFKIAEGKGWAISKVDFIIFILECILKWQAIIFVGNLTEHLLRIFVFEFIVGNILTSLLPFNSSMFLKIDRKNKWPHSSVVKSSASLIIADIEFNSLLAYSRIWYFKIKPLHVSLSVSVRP